MKQRLPQNSVEGVDANTWLRLGALLMQHRGEGLMPHDMANRLGVHRPPVMAMIIVLGRQALVKRRYCIYHRCSEAPVAYRDFEDGFQPTPWVCPECDDEITSPTELRYDLLCLVPEQLDLEL